MGKETKIIELANMIKKLAIDLKGKNLQIVFKNARKGEIRKNYADIKKAKKLLGFKPEINLKKGIREIFQIEN